MFGAINNESLSHQIRSVCLDWKAWFYIFIYMGASTPSYGIIIFLPTIIKDMCHTNPTSAITELFTVPPYTISCLTIFISSWTAGRLNERSSHVMILVLIEISGFLYLILAEKYLYISAMVVSAGALSSNVLILSWITNNIGNPTKRAFVIALVVPFGTLGAVVSVEIYGESDKAIYNQGHWIIIGISCFTFILVLLLKLLLKFENRRRRNLRRVQIQAETVADERQTLLDLVNFVHITSFFQ